MSGHGVRRIATLLGAAALAGLAGGTPASGGSGDCIVVGVPAPVVLPDGLERPSGDLRICVTRHLSPVAAVHRISIDGMPVAHAFSRTGWSEVEAPAEPFVLFHRTPRGALRVVGYAWPEGRAARTYLLAGTSPDWVTASRDRRPQVMNAAAPEVALIASRAGR